LINGVPYDGGVSWRHGAAGAPAAIREVSASIETFSPRLRLDLEDVDVADAGDVDLGGARGEAAIARIAAATEALARAGGLVVTFGGDHSISMGTSRGLRVVHPELAHVVFDAHLDMRPDFDGDRYSHACGTRTMALAGPTCALGIRSGARAEFDDADKLLAGWSDGLELTDAMRRSIAARPVFVSLDLDVLDPGTLPATGTPEPGGFTFRELHEALLALADLRIVGIDLVECAPALDADGPSPYVAAKLAREAILAFAR
jgi:agmatinase